MKHLGNICTINGAEIAPTDIITIGSPCQDMSIAGKREGIKHSEQGDEETTRSGLVYEAFRIIKEMRQTTNGEYPKYAIWENVPGAFSSNKGFDFYAVLEAFCSICDDAVSIPRPYDPKRTDKLVWLGAGEIVGIGYSIAWRTLDAQYWGVPQRRKRIYLVADFTGGRAGEILFKPDSLRGNLPQSNEAGQEVTADAVGGVDGGVGAISVDTSHADDVVRCEVTAPSMQARQQKGGNCVVYSFDSLSSNSMKSSNPFSGCRAVETAKCLDTTYPDPSKNQGGIAIVECSGFDMYNQASTGDKTRTLKTPVGGDDLPVVCILNDQGGSSINIENEDISPTLRAQSHQHEPVIALQANGIDRAAIPINLMTCQGRPSDNGRMGLGVGEQGDPANTISSAHCHAVCFDRAAFNQGINAQYDFEISDSGVVSTVVARGPSGVCYDARGNGDGEIVPTITGDHESRITDYTALAISGKQQSLVTSENAANTLGANDWKEPQSVCYTAKPPRKYIIRRLTPTECARLQGFPDRWGELAPYNPADAEFWEQVRKTHAEINGKKYKPVKDLKKWYDKLHNDGAEYKMWGNGIALPCAEYVIHGIAEHGAKTLGSLFDGSGGFPLAGALNGIAPMWASEVEPYCVAVSRGRFCK